MRFLALFLLPIQLLFALTLTDTQIRYSDFSLLHLYDASNELTIDDISAQNFEQGSNQFTYGYLSGTRWFKLTLENTSSNNAFVLSFSDPLWKEFDLYIPKDGQWQTYHAGLLTPLSRRMIFDTSPAFSINIPKDTSLTVYFRGRSSSGQIGELEVMTAKEYFRPTRYDLPDLYLFLILFLVIVLSFNLYLFYTRPQKLYLFYVLYLTSLMVWFGIKSGLYISLDISGWDEGLHTSGALFVALLTLFSREFLQLEQRFKRLYNIFSVFAVIFFAFTLAIALDIPYTPLLFNLTSSVFFGILLYSSIAVWNDGHLEMSYYLIALFIYMPTMGMLTLTYNGFIDNYDWSRYAFLFGSFCEVIFFNSLMISHYHIIFKDKIRMQRELITLKEENELLLESEIAQRVEELELTNQKLLEKTHELEITQEKLEYEATTDSLSELYNRRYVLSVSHKLFDAARRYGHNLSAVMIDIDNFKSINDAYGHAMGDEVIVHCAKILKKSIRSSDVLARYGGEEYLILVPNTPSAEVFDLCTRVKQTIETEQIPYGNEKPITYTISVGITHIQDYDNSVEQLIQRADKALYRSKAKGKNCVETL